MYFTGYYVKSLLAYKGKTFPPELSRLRFHLQEFTHWGSRDISGEFSRKRGENKSRAFQSGISSRIKMAQCLKMTELMVFATWAGRQSDGIEMQNWFTRLYVFGPYLWAASSLDNTLAKLSQVTSRYPCKLHQLAIQRCLPLLWGPRCLPPFPHLPPIGEAMREQTQFHFLFFPFTYSENKCFLSGQKTVLIHVKFTSPN